MTRQEWLDCFDSAAERALDEGLDRLIERCIAAGCTPDDLDMVTQLWRSEVNAQLPPVRARAVRLLETAPDAAIVWDGGRTAAVPTTVEQIMPAEGAALLISWLEARNAHVFLIEGDYIRVDLDPISDFGKLTPEMVIDATLALRDEIRQILIARRTVH